jgi:hypothetical protein
MTSATETFTSKHKWLGAVGIVLLLGTLAFHSVLWLASAIEAGGAGDSNDSAFPELYNPDKSALRIFFDSIASIYSESFTTLVVAPTVMTGGLGLVLVLVASNESPRVLGRGGVIAFALGLVSMCGSLIAVVHKFLAESEFDDVTLGQQLTQASFPILGTFIALAFVLAGKSMLDSTNVASDDSDTDDESAQEVKAQPAE